MEVVRGLETSGTTEVSFKVLGSPRAVFTSSLFSSIKNTLYTQLTGELTAPGVNVRHWGWGVMIQAEFHRLHVCLEASEKQQMSPQMCDYFLPLW